MMMFIAGADIMLVGVIFGAAITKMGSSSESEK